MNKVDVITPKRYERLFHFLRRTYHRLPLPEQVKWRIREKLWPFIETLREGRSGLFKAILKVPKQGEIFFELDPPRERALRKIICYLGNECKDSGPIGHVIALPFLGTGGAEMTALNFSGVVRGFRPDRSVLLVLTDRSLVSEKLSLPAGTIILVLDDFVEEHSNYFFKKKLLYDLLLAIKPRVFHNINSEVGWHLIISYGERIRSFTKIFASIFSFQYGSDGRSKIGYAANFFRGGFPFLTALLSDNRRFVEDLISEYEVSNDRDRLVVVYNPCRVLNDGWSGQARRRILSRITKFGARPRILWAGRLDAEKRFDLFIEVVKHCPFADFEVFGQKVVDGSIPEVFLPNLFFRGPFSHPEDLVAQGNFDAFIFTSKWEGMPNILLEVGALGIPIIAPVVGGVGELINEETGYPVTESAEADEYVAALQQLLHDKDTAAKKAVNLVDLIERRHSWNNFQAAILEIHGYVEPLNHFSETR